MTRRIGLFGCGPWGRNILRDLVSLGCEVHVWDALAANLITARDGGAVEAYAAIDDVPEVDGCVVATRTSSHADVLDELCRRAIPAFVEKPMCADADTASRLAAEWGDRLFVMDKWRYHPGIDKLAEVVRSGEIGTPIGITTSRLGANRDHRDVDAMWTLAPHDLSIALHVLGHVGAPEAAVGDVDTDGRIQSAHAILTASDGVWHALHISKQHPVTRREIIVSASAGTAALLGTDADAVEIFRPGAAVDGTSAGQHRRLPFSGELPLLAELRRFVAHLDGGPAPMSSAAEGAATVRCIASIRARILAVSGR